MTGRRAEKAYGVVLTLGLAFLASCSERAPGPVEGAGRTPLTAEDFASILADPVDARAAAEEPPDEAAVPVAPARDLPTMDELDLDGAGWGSGIFVLDPCSGPGDFAHQLRNEGGGIFVRQTRGHKLESGIAFPIGRLEGEFELSFVVRPLAVSFGYGFQAGLYAGEPYSAKKKLEIRFTSGGGSSSEIHERYVAVVKTDGEDERARNSRADGRQYLMGRGYRVTIRDTGGGASEGVRVSVIAIDRFLRRPGKVHAVVSESSITSSRA